jgi:hypothetical protein
VPFNGSGLGFSVQEMDRIAQFSLKEARLFQMGANIFEKEKVF